MRTARSPHRRPAPAPRRRTSAPVDVDDTAPTLFDDLPTPDEEPPTRPLRPGEIPPAR
ncbi:hypothetical protein LRS13_22670 [Svornostia abyssi]|uniref:Uncharacterized protein n=1 Tax=Svornostia abyssi TaxID=2898438 RepID=A0ABY5PG47_9ACTN|nr:hypothetical protein LRS13_22670 [Parviterribacteraceae bacterium J379]